MKMTNKNTLIIFLILISTICQSQVKKKLKNKTITLEIQHPEIQNTEDTKKNAVVISLVNGKKDSAYQIKFEIDGELKSYNLIKDEAIIISFDYYYKILNDKKTISIKDHTNTYKSFMLLPTPKKVDTDEIYLFVERMPEFYGGEEALLDYINQRVKRLDSSEFKMCYIGFVVEKDGKTSNVKFKKSCPKNYSDLITKTILEMPKWKPGQQNNIPVRVYFEMPITISN